MASHPIFRIVDAIYVINLPYRTDRRAEMAAELARLDVGFGDPVVELFAAARPNDPGPFPTVGTRGCFLSHLGVLKAALAAGHRTILLLEDDASFLNRLTAVPEAEADAIAAADWDMLYFGYRADRPGLVPAGDGPVWTVPDEVELELAHAVAFRASAVSGLVPYLERMLTRPLGHPEGGPMHVDGAYGWFRREHPDIATLATREQWIVQRSSRTDIHETGWKEHLPFIGLVRRLRNRFAPR